MDKQIFFTVVDQKAESEVRIEIADKGDNVNVTVDNHVDFSIGKEQLTELGALFLFIARKQYDSDCAAELLVGYGKATEAYEAICYNFAELLEKACHNK